MKKFKIIYDALLPALFLAVVFTFFISCNRDDKLTGSIGEATAVDVSSRITGFSSAITGAGAQLTANGSSLSNVKSVFVDGIPSPNIIEVTDNSVTFIVPTNVSVGNKPVDFVFAGVERARSNIEVVSLQVISSYTPYAAASGDQVTILGSNLDIVNTVRIGNINATITEKTSSLLRFTVPANAPSEAITLVSDAGFISSSRIFIPCDSNPNDPDCRPALNLNSGLELGDGDEFTHWGKWNGGQFMFASTSPSQVFRGNRSLRVIRDGSLASGQWRLQFASDLFPTELGASYTAYLYIRSSQPGATMRMSTQPDALFQGDFQVTTQWTRISWTWVANVTAGETRLMLDMNGTPEAVTEFYIDDVKVLKN